MPFVPSAPPARSPRRSSAKPAEDSALSAAQEAAELVRKRFWATLKFLGAVQGLVGSALMVMTANFFAGNAVAWAGSVRVGCWGLGVVWGVWSLVSAIRQGRVLVRLALPPARRARR